MNLALSLSEEAAAQLFKVAAGPGKILVLHKLTESNSITPAATGNRGLWRLLLRCYLRSKEDSSRPKKTPLHKAIKGGVETFFFLFVFLLRSWDAKRPKILSEHK